MNNKRANSSEDAYGYCVGEEGRGLVGVQKPKQKKRHSIMSRAFYYVPVGEVDHLTRLELGSVEGIKSHFCFIGSSGSEGELELVERSCFECESCFDLAKARCNQTRHTGPLCHVEMMDNTTARPSTRAAQAALLKKVKKHVRPSMNIVVRLQQQHGSWVAAKACSKVYQLKDTQEDREIRRNTRWNKGTWVVQVEQYDKCEKAECENDSEQQYRLGKQRCKSWLCNCGVNADVPCHKQHRSVYKACNIREPLGFKMSVPQQTMQTKAKKAKNARSTYVAYCMSPGVEQSIQNNLDPAHVQVEK